MVWTAHVWVVAPEHDEGELGQNPGEYHAEEEQHVDIII